MKNHRSILVLPLEAFQNLGLEAPHARQNKAGSKNNKKVSAARRFENTVDDLSSKQSSFGLFGPLSPLDVAAHHGPWTTAQVRTFTRIASLVFVHDFYCLLCAQIFLTSSSLSYRIAPFGSSKHGFMIDSPGDRHSAKIRNQNCLH